MLPGRAGSGGDWEDLAENAGPHCRNTMDALVLAQGTDKVGWSKHTLAPLQVQLWHLDRFIEPL